MQDQPGRTLTQRLHGDQPLRTEFHAQQLQMEQPRWNTLSPMNRNNIMSRPSPPRMGGVGSHCSLCIRLQLIQVLAMGSTIMRYRLNMLETRPLHSTRHSTQTLCCYYLLCTIQHCAMMSSTDGLAGTSPTCTTAAQWQFGLVAAAYTPQAVSEDFTLIHCFVIMNCFNPVNPSNFLTDVQRHHSISTKSAAPTGSA